MATDVIDAMARAARDRQGEGWDEPERQVTITVRLHRRDNKAVQVSIPGDEANPRVTLSRHEVVMAMNPTTYRMTLPLSLARKHGLVGTPDKKEDF